MINFGNSANLRMRSLLNIWKFYAFFFLYANLCLGLRHFFHVVIFSYFFLLRRGRAPGPLRAEEEVREARLDDDRQRLFGPAEDN